MPDVSRSTRAYFDTAFVVKCYALENGSADVHGARHVGVGAG